MGKFYFALIIKQRICGLDFWTNRDTWLEFFLLCALSSESSMHLHHSYELDSIVNFTDSLAFSQGESLSPTYFVKSVKHCHASVLC